ncbi:MAG: deoxyribonuclease IV [Eubacterium sp.]|nr:deoxyribonuclease IV [Eubacterium sp.]
MLIIGAHLSASKGYTAMLKQAQEIGANTFQFFTRNPRGGSAKDIDEKDVETFLGLMKTEGFPVILAHAPYTLNCCSAKPETREFALNTFADDLRRMEYTPGQLYNFHPGSHVGQGEEIGIELIADTLNKVLFEDMTTTVLLETMAGKGSEIGKTFEELRAIIDRTELSDKLGVCLDTCHVNDGGYDIVNELDKVLDEFDRVVGLDRLKAIHLNDSKNPQSAHKDRHEKIGDGFIGIDAFERIINHPSLKNLPFFLETPNELDGYAKEIALLRSLYKG